jgi:hypothetical protein
MEQATWRAQDKQKIYFYCELLQQLSKFTHDNRCTITDKKDNLKNFL